MKNTVRILKTVQSTAIIIVVALIGFSFVSCGDGGSGGGPSLKSGSPPASVLSTYGIKESQLQVLFDAAKGRAAISDPDYQGWYETTDKSSGYTIKTLTLIWYDKSYDKYEEVVDELYSQNSWYWTESFDISKYNDDFPPNTIVSAGGTYGSSYNLYNMQYGCAIYYLKGYDGVPKDTLAVAFMTMDLGDYF